MIFDLSLNFISLYAPQKREKDNVPRVPHILISLFII